MGMFDHIVVRIPLPKLDNPESIFFQTKSLDCNLDTYEISKDGILYLRKYGYKYVNDPFNKGRKIRVEDKSKIVELVPQNDFFGRINIGFNNFTYLGSDGYRTENDETYFSREYNIDIIDGKVLRVSLVEDNFPLKKLKHLKEKQK